MDDGEFECAPGWARCCGSQTRAPALPRCASAFAVLRRDKPARQVGSKWTSGRGRPRHYARQSIRKGPFKGIWRKPLYFTPFYNLLQDFTAFYRQQKNKPINRSTNKHKTMNQDLKKALGGSNTPMTQLKEHWRGLPEAEREEWRDLFVSNLPSVEIRKKIIEQPTTNV